MPMKFDFKNGRELKESSTFIPVEKPYALHKVTEMSTSKPGKHGSAKTTVVAKDIVTGKPCRLVYLDCSDKVMILLDTCSVYKVVYEISDTEIVTEIAEHASIQFGNFRKEDVEKMKSELKDLKANSKSGNYFFDEEENPLVIEYAEFGDTSGMLSFCSFKYIKPDDLSKYSITTYEC